MDPVELLKGVHELGRQHAIFQQALWIALENREIVVETSAYGIVKELGQIEIESLEDGRVLVRRSRNT